MINTKHILVLLPIVFILIIITQFFSTEKKSVERINAQTSSENISTNLAFSFRKINALQKLKQDGKNAGEIVSVDEKQAFLDLSYLNNKFFFPMKNNGTVSFDQQIKEIHRRVSQDPQLYSDMLNYTLEASLLANDNKSATQVFALAASLPLGPSNIQSTSEKLLIDLASADREWDEVLFKNALQFYYIQNLIKNERNDSLITNSLEKFPDDKLKQKILQINKEINIYSKSEEAKR